MGVSVNLSSSWTSDPSLLSRIPPDLLGLGTVIPKNVFSKILPPLPDWTCSWEGPKKQSLLSKATCSVRAYVGSPLLQEGAGNTSDREPFCGYSGSVVGGLLNTDPDNWIFQLQ